jgi:hypothetical protein
MSRPRRRPPAHDACQPGCLRAQPRSFAEIERVLNFNAGVQHLRDQLRDLAAGLDGSRDAPLRVALSELAWLAGRLLEANPPPRQTLRRY